MIRTFFAIKFPEKTIREISDQSSKLQQLIGNNVKWVNPKHMHLTLKFIGEFSPDHTEKTRQILSASFRILNPFELCIHSFGVFPNYKKPRVLWFGLQKEPQLSRIAAIIENCCADLGYEKENRPFSPHLTIGRIKNNLDKNEIYRIGAILQEHQPTIASRFTVSKIFFIQSKLTPKGPLYSDLFSITL